MSDEDEELAEKEAYARRLGCVIFVIAVMALIVYSAIERVIK